MKRFKTLQNSNSKPNIGTESKWYKWQQCKKNIYRGVLTRQRITSNPPFKI